MRYICILNGSSKFHLRRFHNKRLISVGRHVPCLVGICDSVNNLSSRTVLHHVCRVRSMNNFQDCWTHRARGLAGECFPRSKSRRVSAADAASSCRGAKWPRKLVNCCQFDYGTSDKRVQFWLGLRLPSGGKFSRPCAHWSHVGAY